MGLSSFDSIYQLRTKCKYQNAKFLVQDIAVLTCDFTFFYKQEWQGVLIIDVSEHCIHYPPVFFRLVSEEHFICSSKRLLFAATE